MLRGLSIPRLGIPGWAGSRSCACTNGWAMGAGAARGLLLLTQLLLPCLAIVSALGCGKGAAWASAGGVGERLKGSAKASVQRWGLGRLAWDTKGAPTWLEKSRVPVKGRPTWLEKGPEIWWMGQHVQ